MNEQNIIAAGIADKQAFEQIQSHVGSSEFSPLGQHWFKQLAKYYGRDDGAERADVATLRALGLSAADARHGETLGGYFDDLPLVRVSAPNVVADILGFKKQQLGLQLAAMLSDPSADNERVAELVARYQELIDAVEHGMAKLKFLDFDTLDTVYDPELIIPLYPKRLREQCLGGGGMPGHHVLIFGRPEAGKTLAAINMTAGIAYSGKRVLYCGNEEAIKSIGTRLACNLAHRNIRDFQSHGEEIRRAALKRGLDRVSVVELAPGTFAEIELAIAETSPDAVVIDQLAGVDVGETNPVRSMDKAARSFRTLIQKSGVLGISVSQAGDRTERHGQIPPAWLTMSDVYGSRTGLPAQCDLMLGIGYDQDMYARDLRACSLPKNKIGGSHEGFKVRIDKQQSRILSLGTPSNERAAS